MFDSGPALNMECDYFPVAVHPCNSIIRQVKQALLAKINDRAADCCNSQDEQERTDELALQILQHPELVNCQSYAIGKATL